MLETIRPCYKSELSEECLSTLKIHPPPGVENPFPACSVYALIH